MSFNVEKEVSITDKYGETLYLQYGQLNGGDKFYRFHRRKANGKLITYGQAVIPSLADVNKLIAKAIDDKWDIV